MQSKHPLNQNIKKQASLATISTINKIHMKQNNLRTIILFLSLVYSAIAFGASNNADSVYIGSLVVDDFTGEVIDNASVRVFDQNSHLVSESNSWGSPSMNNNRLANFIVRIPRKQS